MENKVLIETSARHIHLTAEAVEILYGKGAALTVKKDLSQPGQYAAGNEKITLVGPKGTLAVSVLGPTRPANQVELSYSDARALGIAGVLERLGQLEGEHSAAKRGLGAEVGRGRADVEGGLGGGAGQQAAGEEQGGKALHRGLRESMGRGPRGHRRGRA